MYELNATTIITETLKENNCRHKLAKTHFDSILAALTMASTAISS